MRYWFVFLCSALFSVTVFANENVYLPLESGDEVTINIYPATFGDADKPVLVWFTEGYASRPSFRHLITQLNDEGYDVWQVDLLDSYFMQRTPYNIRSLTGEGVAVVLNHINQQNRAFVPISSGRMSLVLLRGLRLWQVTELPEQGIGYLKQVISFFPNFYNAPEKAGDAPQLFPIVSASSLPITLVQPTEGAYRWKIAEMVTALETQQSQVTIAAVPKVRDWYFLRQNPSELERKASEAIPAQIASWLQIGQVSEQANFKPLKSMETKAVTTSLKGLVPISSKPALDFKLSDIEGQSIQLSDKRGRVILLNFWASWCPPCVEEIPSMNRLADSFNKDEFEIVSVNFKESPATIKAFLDRVQVDFPVLIDAEGQVSAGYEIFAFPSSFIIDAEGQVRYSVNAAIEWDSSEVKSIIKSLME